MIAATLQIVLAALAWADLARRPSARVRGPKGLWACLIGVNFAGPLAYFRYGRRRPSGRPRTPPETPRGVSGC